MYYIIIHAKFQRPQTKMWGVRAFSNLHKTNMVAMETNSSVNVVHLPSNFPASLVPIGM